LHLVTECLRSRTEQPAKKVHVPGPLSTLEKEEVTVQQVGPKPHPVRHGAAYFQQRAKLYPTFAVER
jgi:hypothetical protein